MAHDIRKIVDPKNIRPGNLVPKHTFEIVSTAQANIITEDHYLVIIRITDVCDLKCDYCHWSYGPQYDVESITRTIDELYSFFNRVGIRKVNFYFHGGEPTRHKNVIEILQHIKAKSASTAVSAIIEMQTNLTLDIDRLQLILPYCDLLNISFHYWELKNRSGKLQAFERNFEFLRQNTIHINNFDIMLENIPDSHKQECNDLALEFLTYENINHSEMIYGYFFYSESDTTTEKHINFYKKNNKTEQVYKVDGVEYNTNELFRQGVNFKGWHCDVGSTYLYINGSGEVFKCSRHALITDPDNHPVPYTNVLTDTNAQAKLAILFKTGTRCQWDHCGGEYYLDKYK